MAIALASVSAIFFGFSNICYKIGIDPLGEFTAGKVLSVEFLSEFLTSKWVIAGVLLTAISGIFYITAMSYGDVVKVVAVLSLSYLVTAVLAKTYLGESLTMLKIGGLGLIVLGIILVHAKA